MAYYKSLHINDFNIMANLFHVESNIDIKQAIAIYKM